MLWIQKPLLRSDFCFKRRNVCSKMFSGAQIILCTSHANIKWNKSQNLTFLLSPVRPFRLLLLQVLQTRFLTRFSTWCPETESVAAVKTRLSPLQLKCEKPSFWFQTHLRLRPPPLAQRARLCQDWKKREQWRVKITKTKSDSCSAGRLKAVRSCRAKRHQIYFY